MEIKLKIQVNAATPLNAADFDVPESWVIRCVSTSLEGEVLTINATKSKSSLISTLIFIDLPENPVEYVRALYLPLTGEEADYDITRAEVKMIEYQSAKSALDSSGLTYDNWLDGTLSGADQFPCCQ
jgi:hypothetical protein